VNVAAQIPGIGGDILELLRDRSIYDEDEALAAARDRLRSIWNELPLMMSFGADVVNRLCIPDRRRRYVREVLAPAKQRRLTSGEGWARTSEILGLDVGQRSSQMAPGWTVAFAGGADAGFFLGLEGNAGFGGLFRRKGIFYISGLIGVGAYCKASGGIEAVFARCHPLDFGGAAVGIDLGGAYYAGLTLGVSIKAKSFPKLFLPAHIVGRLTLDDLDSLSIGVPFGMGVELSYYLEGTKIFPLPGPEDPPPPEEKVNAPSDLTASLAKQGRRVPELTWRDNSNNESGFYVERAVRGGQFTQVGEVGANITRFTEPEDLPPAHYDYRVQAYKGKIHSPYSGVASVRVPGPPGDK
jgi:hypothetical protein